MKPFHITATNLPICDLPHEWGVAHAAYDNGQIINPNLVDYVLPSLGDMPEMIDPIAIEIPHKNGPFGAKGIGESALIPVAPAIANAIYDAVGVRIKDLPIKAEKIYLGLEALKVKS